MPIEYCAKRLFRLTHSCNSPSRLFGYVHYKDKFCLNPVKCTARGTLLSRNKPGLTNFVTAARPTRRESIFAALYGLYYCNELNTTKWANILLAKRSRVPQDIRVFQLLPLPPFFPLFPKPYFSPPLPTGVIVVNLHIRPIPPTLVSAPIPATAPIGAIITTAPIPPIAATAPNLPLPPLLSVLPFSP